MFELSIELILFSAFQAMRLMLLGLLLLSADCLFTLHELEALSFWYLH